MHFKLWLTENVLGRRRLYHGTSGDFDQFDLTYAGTRDYGDFGIGIYLTPSSTLASMYANNAYKENGQEPFVYVVEHNLQNPANFDDPAFVKQVADALDIPFPKKLLPGSGKQSRPKEESLAITKYVTDLGYDSAVGRDGKEIVAYDPSKLRIVEKVPAGEASWMP